MSRRTDRMASLFQIELSEIVLRRLKDPRIGFVTLTGVDVAPDLKSARVYYSVLGEGKQKMDTQAALEHAAGFLQHEIADSLKLRFTPKFSFHLDESAERGERIERILHELNAEKESPPARKVLLKKKARS